MDRVIAVSVACLTTSASAMWKQYLPDVNKPVSELCLRTGETIRTLPGNVPSYRYRYLDQHLMRPDRSNVFGVRTGDEEVTLTLHVSSSEVQPLRFAILGQGGYNYNCNINFDSGEMKWFILETSIDYMALYEARSYEALEDLSFSDGARVNFNIHDSCILSSLEEAVWDVQCHELPEDYVPYLSLGTKWMKETLQRMKEQQWRCEEAKIQRQRANAFLEAGKYEYFHSNFCAEYFDKSAPSVVGHEAILRLSGAQLLKRGD